MALIDTTISMRKKTIQHRKPHLINERIITMNNFNPHQYPVPDPLNEGPALAGYIGGMEYRHCNEIWFCTESSGAWGVIDTCKTYHYPKSMIYPLKAAPEIQSSVLLRTPEDVAKWVYKLGVEQPPCTAYNPSISCQQISATVLAVYPGYFTPSDNEARRCTVLNSFLEGLRVSSGEYAAGALVSFVESISFNCDVEHFNHSIQYMPEQFVALLVAHGLSIVYQRIWGKRFERALVLGCLYQLTNPAEKYYKFFLDANSEAQVPLILELSPRIKGRVLKLAGLTNKDVEAAQSLAMATDTNKGHEYMSAFLHYLCMKSTLANKVCAEPALELPALC